MTSFHEGMVMATYPLTWVSVSDGRGIEGFARRAELRVLTPRFLDGGSCTRCRGNGDFVAVGSYTSMSKGQAMIGGSTSHTPCMAGRGRHDELPDGCGKSVLPLQRVKLFE